MERCFFHSKKEEQKQRIQRKWRTYLYNYIIIYIDVYMYIYNYMYIYKFMCIGVYISSKKAPEKFKSPNVRPKKVPPNCTTTKASHLSGQPPQRARKQLTRDN